MEVTYKKNLNRSYMCIGEQGRPIEEYELYILEKHQIPGVLQMQTACSEGKRRYLYDISGKQQIDDYFSGRKISYEELQGFLLSVQELCVSLSEYLLREEGICLEMEFIYVSLEDGSMQFTYLPFYEKNLQEAFEMCMEQLLRKIDHQDKAAVELGYYVYQLCSKGNANIEKLLKVALGKTLKQPIGELEKAHGNTTCEKEKMSGSVQTSEEKEKLEDKNALESKDKKVFWRMTGTWRDELEKKKYQILEMIEKYLPGFHKIKESQEQTGKMPLEDMEIPVHPTEILGVCNKHPVGKLVYQGAHQCEDILVEGESFLLGKNREQVDGVILAEGVSRLHARISRQEDKYYIEDLNSTNGTYLNDSALEYREPREIKKNDRICFGTEEYLFL